MKNNMTNDSTSFVDNISKFENTLIRLSLKKPTTWKWKLTTSASSPQVYVPNIQLVDESGGVLLDTREKYSRENNFSRKTVSFCCKNSSGNSSSYQNPNLTKEYNNDKLDHSCGIKNRFCNLFKKSTPEKCQDNYYSKYLVQESNGLVLVNPKFAEKTSVRITRHVSLSDKKSQPDDDIKSIFKTRNKSGTNLQKHVSFSYPESSSFNEIIINSYKITNNNNQNQSNKGLKIDSRNITNLRCVESNVTPVSKSFHKRCGKCIEYNDSLTSKNSDTIFTNYFVKLPSESDGSISCQRSKVLNYSSDTARRSLRFTENGGVTIKELKDYKKSSSKGDFIKYSYHDRKTNMQYNIENRRRKVLKNRQPAESICSSSSSESEIVRTPRGRKKKVKYSERFKKGDRLVEVDGQKVTCPESARDLLRTSSEVVRLQLLRNDLSRHRIEKEDVQGMGSNLSRHSGKGLNGRRTQSSGNLCNGKILVPGVGRFFSPCGRNVNDNVCKRDRYKFCGSLPNHLDAKDPVPVDESSYRNNNNEEQYNYKRNDLELQLVPLGRSDQDQGYASERSPEEIPPPPPPPQARLLQESCPYVSPENTFRVSLIKGSRGLGLSVTGGMDSDAVWPGLVRIKRLFPHQPAWECGRLKQGDILLTANNTPLTGLTNYEALEVLRTTPSDVTLTVCRPPDDTVQSEHPAIAPPPPKRDPSSTIHLSLPLGQPKVEDTFGEFEIMMTKVNGSLGFTLRKEDESVLGHYIRALVREPALSDGRIKPGDKIVAVNDVDMSQLTHEEAVMFLRQCGQDVRLRLYRDHAQTPVSTLSPVQSYSNIQQCHKPILRKEAQDMLSDLAVKKSQSLADSGTSSTSRLGRSSSPRKRRIIKTPSPDSKPNGLLIEENLTLVPSNDRIQRPDSLNLSDNYKPHFRISSGDIDTKNLNEAAEQLNMPPLSEPVSMPPIHSSSSEGFSYRNPAYRSANPTAEKSKCPLSEDVADYSHSDQDLICSSMNEKKTSIESSRSSKGLLKWKGVVFSPEEGVKDSSPDETVSQITDNDSSENLILFVELNRGWNSRLGFSLQSDGQSTVISAIYPDSVASRDGRLKPGDHLIMVNDENVEGMNTSEVIDLLRKIRGSICIAVWRKKEQTSDDTENSSSSASSTATNSTQIPQIPHDNVDNPE